jgi:hypothetical protein
MLGLSTMSTPMNPTRVADQRRRRTVSPSTRAARTVANNGAVKLSAVALARVR